jgi:ketosteroid isomerase-like protein
MSRREIEAREREFVAAFNGGDAAALARLYGENARILPPNADIV